MFSSLPARHGDHNYKPLRTEGSPPAHPWRRNNWKRLCTLTNSLVALSVLSNLFFVVNFLWTWPDAMDNYQSLNHHPIMPESAVAPLASNRSNEFAVVTSLYTDAFATAVATLGHTLNAANSSAARIMLYLPERVSARALCIASASGFRPLAVERIPPPHAGVHRHFLDQFSKLRLWTLDTLGVRALVYLDADTLVRRNFDELFALPHAFAAVPDVFLDGRGFASAVNAGVLFVRPDSRVFADMLPKIASARYPAEDAEQAFLNHYYGVQALRLPYAYNANLAIKKRQPRMWRDLLPEARIVHYTLVKPFLQGDYAEVDMDRLLENVDKKKSARGGLFADEVEEWGRAWRATRRVYGDVFDRCQSASASASA